MTKRETWKSILKICKVAQMLIASDYKPDDADCKKAKKRIENYIWRIRRVLRCEEDKYHPDFNKICTSINEIYDKQFGVKPITLILTVEVTHHKVAKLENGKFEYIPILEPTKIIDNETEALPRTRFERSEARIRNM